VSLGQSAAHVCAYSRTLLPADYRATRAERQTNGLYDPSIERIHAVIAMVRMLIASRRLQIVTARRGGKVLRGKRRSELLSASRHMVNIYVQLGAGNRLQHCDICEFLCDPPSHRAHPSRGIFGAACRQAYSG
jgi:hypothetical protein